MSKSAALRRFRARQNGATMLSQVRRLAAIGLILSAGIAAPPAFADTLPSGASIAAGSARVDASANSVTVDQPSARAVINWSGFSVGAGNNVVFNCRFALRSDPGEA